MLLLSNSGIRGSCAVISALLLLFSTALFAQPVINEILINPPGSVDPPNEYIELRGAPNQLLSSGTYLLEIEGDSGGKPGTIQNIFDLSGKQIGGNGFLLLLQKTNLYQPNSNATLLVNNGTGIGWGSGSSSSIRHRGESGQTDLENGSATFFLIQSPTPPTIGTDIDSDTNGIPDGPAFASWTILDSVGILDDSGADDIAYGAINFRRNPAATASGTVVPVSFNTDYLARNGNTTGSSAAAWLASSSLTGTAPNWTNGSTANTVPSTSAGLALNHLGSPNFGAPSFPGVVAIQSNGSTDILEGSGTDSYGLTLNLAPTGAVTIQIETTGQLQISTDGGLTFGATRTVTFGITIVTQTVTVRAIADNIIDTSPHILSINHRITATGDTARYPTTSLMPVVNVNITEKDAALLSELKVNPPGTDEPFEYVEIKGPPNATLTNVYFLAIEGDSGGNPGAAKTVINLTSARIGSSGLLVLLGNGNPYFIPGGTTALLDSHFNIPGGCLGNGSASFLLVGSPSPITETTDLDSGNNGTLEGLPPGSYIMDALGWLDGNNTNDIVYGGALLSQPSGMPEAATRFAWNNTPRSTPAWFFGELKGPGGNTLTYSDKNVSPNFPTGTPLTPGIFRNSAPAARSLAPICGAIGDPHNPTLTFQIIDADNPPDELTFTLSSSNWLVIPDSQLAVTALGAGWYTLALNPIGVGYSLITIEVTDDDLTARFSFPYAASAQGRPGGSFLIGAADASAAIPIDANWMLVGDDENQILRLYSRTQSGYPVRQFNMTPFLGLTDIENGIPREVDIEAATRVGNRLFWIGAHSHANIAEGRTNRSRVFAVDMVGTGTNISLNYVGRYDYLKLDLVSWDENNVHGKGPNYYGLAASTEEGVNPKDTNGFNIEGLTMVAGSANSAYVCLRAPIVPAANRTYSLIIPVLNFAALAVSDGPPGNAIFGPPIELDLYGRGVRSIEGSLNGYIIVGGPPIDLPTNYPMDFRLYTWSGDRNQNAQQRNADLSGLNPEGIVELPPPPWTPATLVQIVSDSGRKLYYGDAIEAKHLPEPNFKKSRSDFVALGDIVKPQPVITSTLLSQTGVTITWRSLKGETYRLQYSLTMDPGSWQDIAGDVLATGPYSSHTDEQPITEQCFYRVLVRP